MPEKPMPYATEAQYAHLYAQATDWLDVNGELDISESSIQGVHLGVPIVEECAPTIDFDVSYAAVASYAPDVVDLFNLMPNKAVELCYWQHCYYREEFGRDSFTYDSPSMTFRLYGAAQSAYHLQSLRVHKDGNSPEDLPVYKLTRNNDLRMDNGLARPEYIANATPGEYGSLLVVEYLALQSLVDALRANPVATMRDKATP